MRRLIPYQAASFVVCVLALSWLMAEVRPASAGQSYPTQASGPIIAPLISGTAPLRPPSPVIYSSSHPHQNVWYTATTVHFGWTMPRHGPTALTYAYAVDRHATVSDGPDGTRWHETAGTRATAPGLANGLWYLHAKARDMAGVWSPVASYALHIDHAPSRVAHAVFSVFAFNPQFDQQSVRLTFSGPGTLHAAIWNSKTDEPVHAFAPRWVTASQPITLTWSGRDTTGHKVPAGSYGLVLRLTDQVGQRITAEYWGLGIQYRRIVVSLRLQRLWAFDGNALVLTTLVTTGNSALPTPLGVFHVWGRFHPYTFVSPWPKSSVYYYPPSVADYALYFRQGGYFIHNSPWRHAWGPGTNNGVGRPGQDYTGTHGCVSVPTGAMADLFSWATTGTVVQVIN